MVAGSGEAAIFQEIFEICPGWLCYNAKCTEDNFVRVILYFNFLVSEVDVNGGAKIIVVHKIHAHFHIRVITEMMGPPDLAVNCLTGYLVFPGNAGNFLPLILQCQNPGNLGLSKGILSSGSMLARWLLFFHTVAVMHSFRNLAQFFNICRAENILYLLFKIRLHSVTLHLNFIS